MCAPDDLVVPLVLQTIARRDLASTGGTALCKSSGIVAPNNKDSYITNP
jgi:hypothetical protein